MPKAPATITSVQPPTTGGLFSAINSISAGLGVIQKRGRNDFHKYNYTTMPDLLKSLAPLMQQHQVIITQSETSCQFLTDGVLRCEYEFTLTHVPTNEQHTIKSSGMAKVTGDRGGFNDRAIQAIATTTRKYLLIGLFNAVTEDQPDVDYATDGRPKPMAKQQAAPLMQRLSDELAAITNLADLQEFGDNHGLEISQLPNDWQKALRTRYVEKLNIFKPKGGTNVTTISPSPKSKLKESITERAIKARHSLNQNDENPY